MRIALLFAALLALCVFAPLARAEPMLEDKPNVECLTCNPRDERIALGDPTFTLMDAPVPANDEFIMHPNESFDQNLILNDIVANSKRGLVEYVPDSVWCDKGYMEVQPNGDFIYYPAPHWQTDPLAWEDKDNWTTEIPVEDNDYDGYAMCHYSTRWVGGEPSTLVAQSTVFLYAILTKITFVDNKKNLVACEGDGTEANPFATLEEAMNGHNSVCGTTPISQPSNWRIAPGDIVHVASSAEPYFDGIELLDSNRLVCGGVDLIADDGRLLIGEGVRPVITNEIGAAVELAQGNTVEGCILSDSVYGVSGNAIVFPASFHFTLITDNDYGFSCINCDNEWYIGYRDGRITEIIDSANTAIYVDGGSIALTISFTNVHSVSAENLVHWYNTQGSYLLFDARVNHFVDRLDGRYFDFSQNDRAEIHILAGPGRIACIPDDPTANYGHIFNFEENVDSSLLVDTPPSQTWEFINCGDDGDLCTDTWRAAFNIYGNLFTPDSLGNNAANARVHFQGAIDAECGVAAIWIDSNEISVTFDEPSTGIAAITFRNLYWGTGMNWDREHSIYVDNNRDVVTFDIPITGTNSSGIELYYNEEVVTFKQQISFTNCMRCQYDECTAGDERMCINILGNTITGNGLFGGRQPQDPAVVFEDTILIQDGEYTGIYMEYNGHPVHFQDDVTVNDQVFGYDGGLVAEYWDGCAIYMYSNVVPDTAPFPTPAVHFQANVFVGTDNSNTNDGIGILIESQNDDTGHVVFSGSVVEVWNACYEWLHDLSDVSYCAAIFSYENSDGRLTFGADISTSRSTQDTLAPPSVEFLSYSDADHAFVFGGSVTLESQFEGRNDAIGFFAYLSDTCSYTFNDVVSVDVEGAGLVAEDTDFLTFNFNDAISLTATEKGGDGVSWGYSAWLDNCDDSTFNFNDDLTIDADDTGVYVSNDSETNTLSFSGDDVTMDTDYGIFIENSDTNDISFSGTNVAINSNDDGITIQSSGDSNEFTFSADDVVIDASGLGIYVTDDSDTNNFEFTGITVTIDATTGILVDDDSGTASTSNAFSTLSTTNITFLGTNGLTVAGNTDGTNFAFSGPVEIDVTANGINIDHDGVLPNPGPLAWVFAFGSSVSIDATVGVYHSTGTDSTLTQTLSMAFSGALDMDVTNAFSFVGDGQANDINVVGTGIVVSNGGTWTCSASCIAFASSSSYRAPLSFTNVDATATTAVATFSMNANLATGITLPAASAAVTITGGAWTSVSTPLSVDTGEYRSFTFNGVALVGNEGQFTFRGATSGPTYTVIGTNVDRSALTGNFSVTPVVAYDTWTCTNTAPSPPPNNYVCTCGTAPSTVNIVWNVDNVSCSVASDDLALNSCPTATGACGGVDNSCDGQACDNGDLVFIDYPAYGNLVVPAPSCVTVDPPVSTPCPNP